MIGHRAGPWLWILSLALGCAGSESGAGWTGTVQDSAGVQIVRNTTQPVWGPVDAWAFEEVLTIGEAAGDPDYQFGQIAGLDVTSDGTILVLDNQAQHVKVFSADGVFQRTVGQPGSGPGEFGAGAALLMVGRGDTIIVPDMGNQRVNVFLLNDAEPTSFPLRLDEGVPMRWEMSAQGTLVAQRRALNMPGQGAQSDVDLIARQGYDGSIIDTLMTPPRGETFSFSSGLPEFHFFAAEPVWTLLDDGSLCFATNDAFRISVYDLEGNLKRIVEMPVEPVVVSEDDKNIISGLLEDLFEQQGVPPQAVQMITQSMTFEERFPVFTQLRSGPEESLWIQRVGIPSDMTQEERENWNPMLDQGSAEWDVFDAEGRYQGVVTMPERFTPFSASGDLLYGVWRDDLEVQYVKVYRIAGLRSPA